jgi:hypothetical protein
LSRLCGACVHAHKTEDCVVVSGLRWWSRSRNSDSEASLLVALLSGTRGSFPPTWAGGGAQCRLICTVAYRRRGMQDMAHGRLCGCGRSFFQPNFGSGPLRARMISRVVQRRGACHGQ